MIITAIVVTFDHRKPEFDFTIQAHRGQIRQRESQSDDPAPVSTAPSPETRTGRRLMAVISEIPTAIHINQYDRAVR